MGQNVKWPDDPWLEMSIPQGKKNVAKVGLLFRELQAPYYQSSWPHLVLGK